MNEYETTINTLSQLQERMIRGHWGDIELNEEDDDRYTIALGKAIKILEGL